MKIFCAQVLLLQNERDRTPTGWEVMQSACIPTLHTCGAGSTTRACSRWGRCLQRQRDLIGYMHLLDAYFRKVGKDDDSVQCVPRRKEELEKMFNFLVYHIFDQQGCVRVNDGAGALSRAY